MRLIGLIATGLWLTACTTPPMFPPAVMQDVEGDTFDAKAWMDRAYHSSKRTLAPHKVKLGGVILQVIRYPDGGVIILVNQEPFKTNSEPSATSLHQDFTPWFVITFQKAVDPEMLQTGNQIIAVGTTDEARAELFGGAPRVLPHLKAQCLHIWNIHSVNNMYLCTGENSYAAVYPPVERTFCLEENPAESVSSGKDGKKETVSGE